MMKKRESISRGEAIFRTSFLTYQTVEYSFLNRDSRYGMQRYIAGFGNYARAMECEGFAGERFKLSYFRLSATSQTF